MATQQDYEFDSDGEVTLLMIDHFDYEPNDSDEEEDDSEDEDYDVFETDEYSEEEDVLQESESRRYVSAERSGLNLSENESVQEILAEDEIVRQIYSVDGQPREILTGAKAETVAGKCNGEEEAGEYEESDETSETEEINDNEETEPTRTNTIRLLVSAKHLIIASPVFKAMLSPHFKEGFILRSAGHLELPLFDPCDDPSAMMILLNIMHCRFAKVPHDVGFQLLYDLAVTVDYYQLHELVTIYSGIWIENRKMKIPTSLSNDIFEWLVILWVFRREGDFKNVTKIIMREHQGDIFDSLSIQSLPIPDRILSKYIADIICCPYLILKIAALEARKTQAFLGIINSLRAWRRRYSGSSGQIACPNKKVECDDMILGRIVRFLDSCTMKTKSNYRRYDHTSFNEFAETVLAIEFKNCGIGGTHSFTLPEKCLQPKLLPPRDIQHNIKALVETTREGLTGLNLAI